MCWLLGNASSSSSPSWSTRRCLDMLLQLPRWRMLLRHRRSPKKTALGWDSYASRQSDVEQTILGQSLQCSCTWSLELSAVPPYLRQPDLSYSSFRHSLQTFYVVSETKAQCESPFNCALKILLLSYLLTYLLFTRFLSCVRYVVPAALCYMMFCLLVFCVWCSVFSKINKTEMIMRVQRRTVDHGTLSHKRTVTAVAHIVSSIVAVHRVRSSST